MADERAIRSNEEDLPPTVACGGPPRAAAERMAVQWQLATACAAHAAEQLHTTRALQAADKGGVTAAWKEGGPPRCALAALLHVLGEQVCSDRVDQHARASAEPPDRLERGCVEMLEHAARGVKGERVERYWGGCRIIGLGRVRHGAAVSGGKRGPNNASFACHASTS